jgi:hypothetical protein
MLAMVEERSVPRINRFPRPCPEDFEQQFVELGRLACEEHYQARRTTITRWLGECGEARLKQLRSDRVQARRIDRYRKRPPDFELRYVLLGPKECRQHYRAGFPTFSRWVDECGRERLARLREVETRRPDLKINRGEMGRILSSAFPVDRREPKR